MALTPARTQTIEQTSIDDPNTITSPSVLASPTNEDAILTQISILTGKIRSIDLDASSIAESLNNVEDTKVVLSAPRRGSLSDLPSMDDLKSNIWSKLSKTLRTQLVSLDFGLIGKQVEDLVDRLIAVRERLHVDLVSRTSALTAQTTVSASTQVEDAYKLLQAAQKTPKSSQARLPVELWAQIFFLCLPNDDFVKPDPHEAPLLLCQICSAWRSVATGTPLLWSTLSIRSSWRGHIWKSILERWLSRSGNAFLCLDISIPAYMEASFNNDIMESITCSAQRWYRLRLSLPDNLLRAMLNNHMPVLQKLEFSSIYPIANLDIEASQAPNLRTVALLTKALYPQPLSLPWQHLTSFSSQCWLNMGQHLEILRKCPRLEFYSMCIVYAEIPPDIISISMQHLTRLEIVAFIGNAMGSVFNYLHLPKLTQLSFTIPSESPAWGMAEWPKWCTMSLVERSSCVLTKVRLRGVAKSGGSIRQDIQRCIPSVVDVDVDDPCHNPRLA